MTFLLMNVPFLAIAAAVWLVALRSLRSSRRQFLIATVATFLISAGFTAVFDSLMISQGLFTYGEGQLSGIRIGLAPIEDFAYPLVAALLLPALWTLTRNRTTAYHE